MFLWWIGMLLMPWNMVGDYSFSSSQMLLDNTIESP